MARADLLTRLVQFGMAGDRVKIQRVVETIIAEERAMHHTVLANKLEGLLSSESQSDKLTLNGSAVLDQTVPNLFLETIPERSFDDLILPREVLAISQEVVQEHHRADLLRSYNLEPRNRLLLIGPPGNGKTTLAEAFANALMVPLLIVRYEGIIGTYLGETTVRLHQLLKHARTRRCVLFFDEFDTLGKERGDRHETGEIKRVVSSLLMEIDSLPSHVVVIAATNHDELLDRAVWRRFQVRMIIPSPTRASLEAWFAKFERRIRVQLGYTHATLARKLYGVNFAEAEEFGISAFRHYVLEQPSSDMQKIIERTLKNWPLRTASAKFQKQRDE